MTTDTGEAAGAVPIAAVERDTGLSKDTLRIWERRYGFPRPLRTAGGAGRSYPVDQVVKLRLLKRLVDRGFRAGKVVPLELAALLELADAAGGSGPSGADGGAGGLEAWLDQLRSHDAHGLRMRLGQALLQRGLADFVTGLLAPMNQLVGEAWMAGRIQVFEEHLYTECVQTTLRQAIASMPLGADGGAPRVLLATIPQEPHGLGLLMAEALFALEGCRCLSLGVRTPLAEIAQAARAHRADIVGLSFTASLNPAQALGALRELRGLLDDRVEIWAGGQCPAIHRRTPPGVVPVADVGDVGRRLSRWRKQESQDL